MSIILILTHNSYFTILPLAFLFINNLTKHEKFNNIQFKILNLQYDLMQVLISINKHPTKNEHFPKHTIFSTIYLLQKQKLNPNKYYEHEINMSKFLKATGMMCTCMQSLEVVVFL
jgi:hypothetical protein